MARLIFISPYMKGGRDAARLAHRTRYFATREGVQLLNDDNVHLPVTKKQQQYIHRLLRSFPEARELPEHEDYANTPNRQTAFALIAQMGKAPVNPLAICGWSDITPAGKKIMRPKKCWIRAGKAVSLSDAPAGLKRTERLEWFEAEAMNRVYAMRDELCAEHPGRF